jgi:hypothetical protein
MSLIEAASIVVVTGTAAARALYIPIHCNRTGHSGRQQLFLLFMLDKANFIRKSGLGSR